MEADESSRAAAVVAGCSNGSEETVRVVVETDDAIQCVGNGLNTWASVIDVSNDDVIAVGVSDVSWVVGLRTTNRLRDYGSIRQLGLGRRQYAIRTGGVGVIYK